MSDFHPIKSRLKLIKPKKSIAREPCALNKISNVIYFDLLVPSYPASYHTAATRAIKFRLFRKKDNIEHIFPTKQGYHDDLPPAPELALVLGAL